MGSLGTIISLKLYNKISGTRAKLEKFKFALIFIHFLRSKIIFLQVSSKFSVYKKAHTFLNVSNLNRLSENSAG